MGTADHETVQIMKPRSVVVLGDYEGALAPALGRLLGEAFTVTGYGDSEADESVLATRLKGADVVVVIRERVPLSSALVRSLPSLELLVTTGRSNTVIPHDGPPVLGTRSLPSSAAEHTWALVLSLARDVGGQQARLRAGHWQDALGMGLEGRTLGLVGFRRIAKRVARIARAFEMEVLAYSPSLDAGQAASYEVEYAALEELVAHSDVVCLHAQLNSSSRGVISADLIQAMQPHALLVNTARAGLVDGAAVEQALSEGRLGGFAQDVFEEEPLPANHSLRERPRTVLTPHIGYATDLNFSVFAQDAAENIAEFYRGRIMRGLNVSS